MTQSKKVLRGHIQMLNCFADAYKRMQLLNAHSLYEFSILIRNEHGTLEKVIRYEIGTSFLPDYASECYESLFISLLKQRDITNLLEQCIKYGIATE